jgi:type IV secretory pathway VirJ component
MTDRTPPPSTRPSYPRLLPIALRAPVRRVLPVVAIAVVSIVAFSLIKNVGAETATFTYKQQAFSGVLPFPVTVYSRQTKSCIAGTSRLQDTIAVPSRRFWTSSNGKRFVAQIEKGARARAPDYTLRDLPLVEVPSIDDGDTLAVFVSGDGGWASLVREVSNYLAAQRISVVGLNSLKYFWAARTPERCAQDLERILTYYLSRWHRSRVVLLGYSMGADVLPFMVNRLPREHRAQLRAVVLLGPSERATFEFRVKNWLRNPTGKGTEPLLPEIERLGDLKILCIGGADEHTSLCPKLPAGMAHSEILPGDHHFSSDFHRVAETILRYLQD